MGQVVISVVTVGTTVILLIDDRNERNGLNQKQPGWWAVLTTGCSNQEDVRWQRRWFVLYDDGELTYSVDEHVSLKIPFNANSSADTLAAHDQSMRCRNPLCR
ncbi:Protein outspread [Eufriesea mexicana]|uniref:Protein outspread n=1 Tax=Eufriesea mexicana TaxID=516756 RepID=A0A310SYG0_9HYME|nr:Protein outspread [Eufriesea mexicana]